MYRKTPLSPNNQQVSRGIIRPLLSLGYKNRHDHMLRVGSPRLPGSHPAALAASLISINSSFFSPHYAKNSSSNPHAQTITLSFHLASDPARKGSLIFHFFFLWPHLRHMEVPRLGVESELQVWPKLQLAAMPDP